MNKVSNERMSNAARDGQQHPGLDGCWAVHGCFIALSVLTVCVGCGGGHEQVLPDRAVASGSVLWDGGPLPGGTITFVSKDDPTLRGYATIRDGQYATDRAPIGESWVAVDNRSLRYGNPSAYVALPEKYRDARNSGLSANLAAGENRNVDFELQP